MEARRRHTCVVCEKQIKPKATGRVRETCSDKCRQKLRRCRIKGQSPDEYDRKKRSPKADRMIRAWEREFGPLTQTHKNWGPTPLRDRLKIWIKQGHKIPTCKQCRRPYADKTEAPFCSRRCSRAHRRQRELVQAMLEKYREDGIDPEVFKRVKKGLPVALCQRCGKPYLPDGKRKYCGSACKQATWRERNRTCPECGTRFKRTRACGSPQIYCSKRCQNRYNDKLKWVRIWEQNSRKKCASCGKMFRPGRRSTHQIYCSRSCNRRASYQRERARKAAGNQPLTDGSLCYARERVSHKRESG